MPSNPNFISLSIPLFGRNSIRQPIPSFRSSDPLDWRARAKQAARNRGSKAKKARPAARRARAKAIRAEKARLRKRHSTADIQRMMANRERARKREAKRMRLKRLLTNPPDIDAEIALRANMSANPSETQGKF